MGKVLWPGNSRVKVQGVKNSAPTLWQMVPIHSLEQIHGRWNQGGVDEIASYASEAVKDDVSKFCEAKQCDCLKSDRPKAMKHKEPQR